MNITRGFWSSMMGLAVVACGPSSGTAVDDGSSGMVTTGSSSESGLSSRPPATTSDDSGTTTGTETTTGSPVDSSSGSGICDDPDELALDCDSWAQDCCPGQKCVPHATEGTAWNATRCVPIEPDPQSAGEPCTVTEGPADGFDDCDGASICWDVDTRTGMGECVAQCTGSPEDRQCPDEHLCAIANGGVLHLCLPSCDPLDPQCDEGQGCFPIDGGHVCSPDPGGIGPGSSCEDIAICPVGLMCIAGEFYPGCESLGCCSPLCDPSTPEGEAVCDAVDPALECMPLFEPGDGPEDQGVCGLPGA